LTRVCFIIIESERERERDRKERGRKMERDGGERENLERGLVEKLRTTWKVIEKDGERKRERGREREERERGRNVL
jgi:hypothetical protein